MSLLDVKAVADRFSVGESWVYQNAEAGRLPSIKVGRYLRFDPDEIEAWLNARRASQMKKKNVTAR